MSRLFLSAQLTDTVRPTSFWSSSEAPAYLQLGKTA